MASSGVALALASGAASDALQPMEQDDDGKRSLATRAAQGVAGASVVVNVIALALNFSGVMFVAAAIAAIIGVVVIMQQFVLEDTGSMVEVQNKLSKATRRTKSWNLGLQSSHRFGWFFFKKSQERTSMSYRNRIIGLLRRTRDWRGMYPST